MLTDKQREKLIEKYRYINVEDSYWYSSTFGDIQYDWKEQLGITVPTVDMSFQEEYGRWEFAASVGMILSDKLIPEWEAKYPTFAKDGAPWVYVTTERRSIRFAIEVATDGREELPPSLRAKCKDFFAPDLDEMECAIVKAWQEAIETEQDAMCTDLKHFFSELFRAAAFRLEADYEYWTSDESVWSTIEANELHLTEETQENI